MTVRTNTHCSLSIAAGGSWVSDITTKALADKTFTLSIQRNDEYDQRSVDLVISDSSERIKQTVTLVQSGYTPVYVDIPDEEFLSCLLDNWDVNGDGRIDEKEALSITAIDCSGKSISSLKGIEHFINLTSLDCSKTKITNLDISKNDKLTSIKCKYCVGMTSVMLPNIASIPSEAFMNCTGLQAIVLPETITTLGANAFYGCANLNSLTINSDIGGLDTSLYSDYFGGSPISSLTIAGKATGASFSDCTTLTNISIQAPITSIRSFAGCSGLKYIGIPGSVTTLEQGCFFNCTNLISVSFPDEFSSLRTIKYRAFYGCSSLKLLDMTNCLEVSHIQASNPDCEDYSSNTPSYIFYGVQSITINLGTRTTPTISGRDSSRMLYCYKKSYHSIALHVPTDCIDSYKANSSWYDSQYVTVESL